LRRSAGFGTLVPVDDEFISRDELSATLFAINDIREDVQRIRRLLEEDGDGEAPEDDA
jgi:hypothetical protein